MSVLRAMVAKSKTPAKKTVKRRPPPPQALPCPCGCHQFAPVPPDMILVRKRTR